MTPTQAGTTAKPGLNPSLPALPFSVPRTVRAGMFVAAVVYAANLAYYLSIIELSSNDVYGFGADATTVTMWTTSALILVSPLIVATCALHMRSHRAVTAGGGWDSRRPLSVLQRLVLRDALAFVAIHCVAISAALVVLLVNGVPLSLSARSLLGTLPALTAIAAAAALGHAAALIWDSPLLPPLAAVAAFLLPTLTAVGPLPAGWAVVAGSGSSPDYVFNYVFVGCQVALYVGAFLLAMSFVLTRLSGSPHRRVMGAAAALLVSSATFFALVPTSPLQADVVLPICGGSTIEVCLRPNEEPRREEISEIITRQRIVLNELGITTAVTRYGQVLDDSSLSQFPGSTSRPFSVSRQRLDQGALALALAPYVTVDQRCLSPDALTYDQLNSLQVAGAWVALRSMNGRGVPALPGYERELAAIEGAGPKGLAWLRQTLQAANDCRAERIPLVL